MIDRKNLVLRSEETLDLRYKRSFFAIQPIKVISAGFIEHLQQLWLAGRRREVTQLLLAIELNWKVTEVGREVKRVTNCQ
ncbi:hypothetical protein D3C76_1664030 [compost metagenome]